MRPTSEGGRETPFVAGGTKYRPQFHVEEFEQSTSCVVDKIEGRDSLGPGESGTVTCRLLRPEFFVRFLKPNARFELREGARIVGLGTIEVVNEKLAP